MGFSCHRMRIHYARVKFAVKLEAFFPAVRFSQTEQTFPTQGSFYVPGSPDKVPSNTALLQQRVGPARGSKQETLLQASIASFLVLS
jgi:hypothetical protein